MVFHEHAILTSAMQVTSSLIRTELESMEDTGLPNIPICLFSDGASAIIVGGGDIRPTGTFSRWDSWIS